MTAINNIASGQIKYGIVANKSKVLSGAIIRNLSLKTLITSGIDGSFALPINKGDTILTSYEGLKMDTLIYNNQSPLLLKLKPLPNTLGEVVIRDYRDSPQKKFERNKSDYKQIYRIGDDKDWLMIGLGFAINIQKLYNHFSRDGKNARKLQKTLVRDYYDDVVDSRYTKSLVTKYTGYEGKQLDDFMIDNRPTYDFVKHASSYDLIEYILKAKKNAPPADSVAVVQNAK